MTILGAILLDLDTVVADLFDTPGASHTISATGRTAGTNGLNMTTTVTVKNVGSAVGTLNVAFAWDPTASMGGDVLVLYDAGTAQLTVKPLSDGSVQVYRGTSGAGALLGTAAAGSVTSAVFQHIEVNTTISATVGVVQLWVNGVSVLNLTAQNTKATANSTVSQFGLTAGGTTGIACDIIWSTTRINDCRVECFVPTGAGSHTAFTPSTGANWQNVDEVPPNGDTDYNSTPTVNAIDTFAHGALTSAPLTIKAVVVQVRARNTTAGTGSIAPVARSSSTDSVGTAVALNTSYQDLQTVYETDPATSAAWANAAAVNAAEIGYKKVS